MPVIFHLMNGEHIAVRGEKLGFVRKTLYRFGIGFRTKSYTDNDRFIIRPRATTHIQEITAETAARRRAVNERKMAEGDKAKPAMSIPSGK